jgi:hypothetical protein
MNMALAVVDYVKKRGINKLIFNFYLPKYRWAEFLFGTYSKLYTYIFKNVYIYIQNFILK